MKKELLSLMENKDVREFEGYDEILESLSYDDLFATLYIDYENEEFLTTVERGKESFTDWDSPYVVEICTLRPEEYKIYKGCETDFNDYLDYKIDEKVKEVEEAADMEAFEALGGRFY